MLNLAKLNGITATIVACLNCGMDHDAIARKLYGKYPMSLTVDDALALVRAISAVA